MLKDIEEGRKTEVDAILGYILEEAVTECIELPLVKMVYLAIKGMESERRANK